MGEGIKWMRFPKRERITDRTTMSSRYWDCACFQPTKDIKFLGFGIFGAYNGNDLVFEIKWKYGGEESEVFEFDFAEHELDDETKTSYTVDIRKFGCSAIDMQPDEKVFVFAKCKDNDIEYHNRQVFYGYGGYHRDYSRFDF